MDEHDFECFESGGWQQRWLDLRRDVSLRLGRRIESLNLFELLEEIALNLLKL
jgi:hypothetical protein